MNNLGFEIEMEGLINPYFSMEWNASVSHARYERLDLFNLDEQQVKSYTGNRPIYNPNIAKFVLLGDLIIRSQLVMKISSFLPVGNIDILASII